MAATDALRSAALAEVDIAAACALSSAVGWNQTESDWRVFVVHGRTIGLFAEGRGLVATAAALPYAAGFGWISMVIVAPDWRRRGLARRLVQDCIAMLRNRGCTALLDATPAGAEVYRGIGFLPLARLERWEGDGGGSASGDARTAALATQQIDAIVAADAAAFGSERRFLLADFLRRPGSAALAREEAFLVMRRGQRATQLGPFVAPSARAAETLLTDAVALAQGPVFLDLFEGWDSLVRLLERRGFRRQRPFLRMAQGRSSLPGAPARLVCAAGPEFG